jgi:hypothetical protein
MVGLNITRSAFKPWPQRPCKMMSVSAHTDVQWNSARSQARPNWCKGLTHECARGQCANISAKARGSRLTYLSASIILSTHIAAYKKQETLDQCIPLFLLLLVRASPRTKKQGTTDQRTSLHLLHFIHAFSRAQKARGSTGMCSKFSTWLNKFSKKFTSQQISSSMVWLDR